MSREYNGPNDLSLLVMIGLGLVIVIPGVIFLVVDGGVFLVAAVVGAVVAILLIFRYLNRPRRGRRLDEWSIYKAPTQRRNQTVYRRFQPG